MAMQQQSQSFLRGILFLTVGISLLLHTILPSLFLSTLLIICGALVMVVYGMVLLNLHMPILNALKKRMPHEKE